jgi:hypothetical protein
MLKFLGNIIQLIFSPQKGWEDLSDGDYRADGRRGNIDVRNLYLRNFIPLIVFCSLTFFVRVLFENGPDFLKALQVVIIQFFSLFLSYHVAVYVFSAMLPRIVRAGEQPDQRRAAIMILYCISVIALIFLIGNIIKIKLALISFLPFYAIFIIWKGATFIGIPEENIGPFMLMSSLSVLGSIYGLSFIFNLLIVP